MRRQPKPSQVGAFLYMHTFDNYHGRCCVLPDNIYLLAYLSTCQQILGCVTMPLGTIIWFKWSMKINTSKYSTMIPTCYKVIKWMAIINHHRSHLSKMYLDQLYNGCTKFKESQSRLTNIDHPFHGLYKIDDLQVQMGLSFGADVISMFPLLGAAPVLSPQWNDLTCQLFWCSVLKKMA